MQTHERSSDELFLERVYAVLLRRVPDPEGKAAFLTRLESGTSRLVVIEDILTSSEYRILGKSAREFIEDLYRVLLRRDPTPSDGLADWTEFVHAHGRGPAFHAFTGATEVQLRIAEAESFEVVEAGTGWLRVTFLRQSVLLTFGAVASKQPLEIKPANWGLLRPALDASGFELLSFRIDRHLNESEPAVWE